jgi:uncharacterized delta-60 repeat protein
MNPHRQRIGVFVALGTSLLAISAGVAQAAPTDLDAGFGTNGSATLDLGGSDTVESVAVQADGKVLVVGATSVNSNAVVYRLNRDGSPDKSFDHVGVQTLNLGGSEKANAVAVQPDGKIVVVGSTSVFDDAAVWRLNEDGSPDMSFDNDGVAGIDLGGREVAYDVAVQPDSKILVAGSTVGVSNGLVNSDAFVYRLDAQGKPDTGFGTQAVARIGVPEGDEQARAIALQPDGKIVVAGHTSAYEDALLTRLEPNGAPDQAFGAFAVGDGLGANGYEYGWDVAVQPDGEILVAASTSIGYDGFVSRVESTGTADVGFGKGGSARIDNGGQEETYRLALQHDGKIVVAGVTAKTDYAALAARLKADGSADQTFAPKGLFTLDRGTVQRASGLALQPDGKILLAGSNSSANGNSQVFRLQGDPQKKTGSGGSGGGPGGSGGSRTQAKAITCAGRRATIVGTARADRIRGTRKRDVIAALGGNDVVKGLSGNDLICGGAGNDRIYGGKGRDVLRGEAGRDRLSGGPGHDRLLGGPGRNLARQ